MAASTNYSIGKDGIAIFCIDIPDRAVNVLTTSLLNELGAFVEKVGGDEAIRGAIISSAKSDFLVGADLKEIMELLDRGFSPLDGYVFSQTYNDLLRKLETCGKPIAAVINGSALGGGLELALACHYRVLTNNPAARIGLPEVKLGLMPGGGGTQRLPRLIGIEAALPLLLEGKSLGPNDAKQLGIADLLAPQGRQIVLAKEWLLHNGSNQQPWDKKGFKIRANSGGLDTFMVSTALTAKNTNRNYPAPLSILSAVFEGSIVSIDSALRIESRYFGRLLADPVSRNMVRTLYKHRRNADGLARRPANVPTSTLGRIGILGAGMMGSGIAYVSANAELDTVLLDIDLETAEKGKEYSRRLVRTGLERGTILESNADALLKRINATNSYSDIEDCDLVIEAVFEDRGVKATVARKAEAVLAKKAVFASNTSTLPITELAEYSKRPGNFIGLHFFSPVDRMPLVEIIAGARTSDNAIAVAMDYVAKIRKTPILVNDSRGFYTTRVFTTFLNEGQTMLCEGIRPALIENAAKLAGMPIGPLELSDAVSMDLQYRIINQTRVDLGDDWKPPSGEGVISKFVAQLGRPGKRDGKGFYDYPSGQKKRLWPGLLEIYPPSQTQPDVKELIKRFLHVQALEATRCVEEGVIADPGDADLGSVLGWGFPSYTGGVLSYIDTLGIDRFVSDCDQMAEIYGSRFFVSQWLRDRARSCKTFNETRMPMA